MKPFSMIVAATSTGGIGQKGTIPWRLPRDMAYFKQVTTQAFRKPEDPALNAVVMGRKTWESIPEKFRPLPGRINVVLTRTPHTLKPSLPSGVHVFASLDEALDWADQAPVRHVFVAGGSEVYRVALQHPKCEYLFLTQVHLECECDVVFPFNSPYFELSSPEKHSELEAMVGQQVPTGRFSDKGVDIEFHVYRRRTTT